MSSLESHWLIVAFVLINVFLDLAPAASVERVVAEGAAKGVVRAQAAVLGIVFADLLWCLLAVAMLYVGMMTVPLLLYGAKWVGLVCLVVLLCRSLRIAIVGRGVRAFAPAPHLGAWTSFRTSFVQQMTHPTAMIFFFAVLSVFAGSRNCWEVRLIDLGVFAVLLEWPVFALYALLGADAMRAAERSGVKSVGETLAGLALLAATGMVAAPSGNR